MELSIFGVSRGIYVWKNLTSVSHAHLCVFHFNSVCSHIEIKTLYSKIFKTI